MCKVSRGSEDHLVQGLADFGSFSQKMPLKQYTQLFFGPVGFLVSFEMLSTYSSHFLD